MKLEDLISAMKDIARFAQTTLPSDDPIDAGVWKACPPADADYLRTFCPFNVLRVLSHIEKLQNELTAVQETLNGRLIRAQAIALDIRDILDEFDSGEIPERQEVGNHDVRDRVVKLLQRLARSERGVLSAIRLGAPGLFKNKDPEDSVTAGGCIHPDKPEDPEELKAVRRILRELAVTEILCGRL